MTTPAIQAAFAPQLIIKDGIAAIEFYKKAFGATELGRWTNEDGSIHVAELSFLGALFHIREESAEKSNLTPATAGGNTIILGVWVDDVHAVFNRAVAAGATVLTAVEDYEYGYRQGSIKDPFGHHWLIEKKI